MLYGLHLSHDLAGYYQALIYHIYLKKKPHSDLFRDWSLNTTPMLVYSNFTNKMVKCIRAVMHIS